MIAGIMQSHTTMLSCSPSSRNAIRAISEAEYGRVLLVLPVYHLMVTHGVSDGTPDPTRRI